MACAALVCVGGALLAGCGWHLRTWDFGDSFSDIYLTSDDSVDVELELRRALRSSGVTVVETADEGPDSMVPSLQTARVVSLFPVPRDRCFGFPESGSCSAS